MKVKVRYVGQHQPNEILEVEEDEAKKLVESGECQYENTRRIPDESWHEKDIKKWIEDNKLPLKYDIDNVTKARILEKIRKLI